MSFLLVIPARYASTRYPGKPLVPLKGATGMSRSLLERSWRAAKEVAGDPRIVIATDDERIRDHAEQFGAEVVMTSQDCQNGTERCAQAYASLGATDEIVVNLQGDAPLTPAWFVENLVADLARSDSDMATPVLRCTGRTLQGLLADRKAGRVGGTTAVMDQSGHAMYFSKEVLPFINTTYPDNAQTPVFHHVGVYAYRASALAEYAGWRVGNSEQLEGLEQLRFLENQRRIKCVEVEANGREFWELNNPEDVPKIEAMMAQMGMV